MWRNSATGWGRLARFFHWLMVLIIAVQFPLGLLMVEAYDAWLAGNGDTALVMLLSRAHNTLGFLVLIVVLLRLGWRTANPTPQLPAALKAWQRLTARTTHVALYGLLILLPLSGWSALSAYDGEFPIFFFGWDDVPRLVPQATPGSPFTSDLFGEIHESALWVLGTMLAMHVIAAVWHQFVLKDGILARMWRG
ncbi:MAG: cytochrome b [Gammaproteobacteria bacterium]|nr:cytochrome b [Gammaproteobacteria bacterium]